jgi:hypothetical protein
MAGFVDFKRAGSAYIGHAAFALQDQRAPVKKLTQG